MRLTSASRMGELVYARTQDWLALVAVHSDSWLIAVSFYYGAKLDPEGRCAEERWMFVSPCRQLRHTSSKPSPHAEHWWDQGCWCARAGALLLAQAAPVPQHQPAPHAVRGCHRQAPRLRCAASEQAKACRAGASDIQCMAAYPPACEHRLRVRSVQGRSQRMRDDLPSRL